MHRPCIKPLMVRVAGDTGRAVAVSLAGLGIFSLGTMAIHLMESKKSLPKEPSTICPAQSPR